MEKIIDRPVLAVIFFIIIMLLGIYSFNNMTIGIVPDPEEGLPSLTVTYSWQGASPDIILQKVLIPAETEIMKIKGVSKIKSRASLEWGTIEVEFNRKTKMNFANVVLRERLNRLQKDLHKSVILSSISERVPKKFKQRPLFRVGIYGKNYTIYNLKKIAEKEIRPYLRSIPGVESVDLQGGVDTEIKIQTDLDRLNKFEISIIDIQNKIR
jgi:multidrug efflux pump subunit AcrB